jgi:hypothetical protein
MAIARNKKADPAAIAAFGAAAESRPDDASTPAVTKVKRPTTATAGDDAGPKSSLIRWTDDELRDRLIDYSKRERYPLQQVMIEALRIGIEQIEKR